MGTALVRRILQGVYPVLIVLCEVGFVPSAAAQTPPPVRPQASSRTIESVTFEPNATLLFLTPEQQRIAYRNVQRLAPTNVIARGRSVSPLPVAMMDLTGFRYAYQNRSRSLDHFMTETRVAGLLVLKDGNIVAERYAFGDGPESVWTSFSVTKSVLSLMYGAAIKDGSIRSLDDKVTRYLPALRGSVYDVVSLRQLLQMSSGVGWNDDDDPNSDLVQMSTAGQTGGIGAVLAYMKRLTRKAPPGTVFNYNTGETNIAGAVLRAATGRSLAQYLSEKVWQPGGMEADAYWLLLRDGDLEYGGCCISATLRDYGRLGLLALHDGVTAKGARVLAKGWMRASTTPASTAADYGYLWWLEGGGRYAASGIFGQYIYIDPKHHIVVAVQSLWPVSYNDELPSHRRAFIEALVRAVGR